MQWLETSGKSSLDSMSDYAKMLSDGESIALAYKDQAFLIPKFAITNFMVSYDVDNPYRVGGTLMYASKQVNVCMALESRGPVTCTYASSVKDLFVNAAKLSVDDLLKLVYQKMQDRESPEQTL